MKSFTATLISLAALVSMTYAQGPVGGLSSDMLDFSMLDETAPLGSEYEDRGWGSLRGLANTTLVGFNDVFNPAALFSVHLAHKTLITSENRSRLCERAWQGNGALGEDIGGGKIWVPYKWNNWEDLCESSTAYISSVPTKGSEPVMSWHRDLWSQNLGRKLSNSRND